MLPKPTGYQNKDLTPRYPTSVRGQRESSFRPLLERRRRPQRVAGYIVPEAVADDIEARLRVAHGECLKLFSEQASQFDKATWHSNSVLKHVLIAGGVPFA